MTTFEWDKIADVEAQENENDKEAFLTACVQQLRRDKELYDAGSRDEVSDCAVNMPRPGGKLDKEQRTAHKLAFAMFPELGDPEDEKIKIWGIIQYSKMISSLSAAVRERKSRQEEEKARPSKKVLRDRCLLRNREATDLPNAVTSPEPMPVQESPLSELQPVIEALSSGQPDFGDSDMVEYTRGVIFRDGRLDLCKQVLGTSHIAKVIDAMQGNTAVQHFLLGNNISGLPCAEAVSRHIKGGLPPHIKTWYLAGNCLDSDSISVLAEAFIIDTHASSLWLKRNHVGAAGAQALGRMLMVNTTLKTLDLLNTGLLDAGVINLFSLLRDPQSVTGLRNLYLDGNGLTAECAPSIAGYFDDLVLQKKEGLFRIWLGMNRLGDEGATVILRSMKGYPYLQSVNLNSNRLTGACGKEIYETFKDHEGILALDVGCYKASIDLGMEPNALHDEGATSLAKLITENKSIRVLHVFENEFTDEGLQEIATALQENTQVLCLGYGQTGVRYNKDVMGNITTSLKRNIALDAEAAGLAEKEKSLKLLFRRIIHGDDIGNIDSIYRNRAMKEKEK